MAGDGYRGAILFMRRGAEYLECSESCGEFPRSDPASDIANPCCGMECIICISGAVPLATATAPLPPLELTICLMSILEWQCQDVMGR